MQWKVGCILFFSLLLPLSVIAGDDVHSRIARAPQGRDSSRDRGGGRGRSEDGDGGDSERGRGAGRKRKKVDRSHGFANLKKMSLGLKALKGEAWNDHADIFCQMFKQNRLCREGKRPDLTQVAEVTRAVERRERRRKIPKILRRDWLAEVPGDLQNKIRRIGKHRFGLADAETTTEFKKTCRGGRIKCKTQPAEAVTRRQLLRDSLLNIETTKGAAADTEEAEDNVELRFDRALRIKRALLSRANLTAEVDPIDDGILEHDLLLTEKQADLLLNDLDKAGTDGDEDLSSDDDSDDEDGKPADPILASIPGVSALTKGRKKRAGIFFEENFVDKWDISQPIPYAFDSSIAPWDETDIKDAIAEIERNTCIRFRFSSTAPSGYHLNYVKINNPTFCGLSYIGRVSPVNPVYLSFQCGKNKGVAIHETMHALGVNHQHLRMDRDTNIKVDWSNVNPQYYDQMAVADATLFTTYGVQYAYDSIMHYNAYTNAIDISKPTMIPLVNSAANLAVLGQRERMSATDISLLNKMYCKATTCADKNIYCGAWALQGTCTLAGNSQWMAANCRKSCNLC